jgi:aspartokinase
MRSIRIDGLKRSRELVQLRFSDALESGVPGIRIFKDLTEMRINIHYLSRITFEKKSYTSFCIAPEAEEQVRSIVEADLCLKNQVTYVPSVGLLSLFPHQFNLSVVGKSLRALRKSSISVFGMATSISSITFITEYGQLDKAEGILRELFPQSDTG